MILPVAFLPAARRETEEAVGWYEAQRAGLGTLFIEEVERAVARSAQFPFAAAMIHKDLRCARIRRFPYSIIHRVEPCQLVIFAVFHARRDPAVWSNRTE